MFFYLNRWKNIYPMFLGSLLSLFKCVFCSENIQLTTERKVLISYFHTVKNGSLQSINQKISDIIVYDGKKYKFKD